MFRHHHPLKLSTFKNQRLHSVPLSESKTLLLIHVLPESPPFTTACITGLGNIFDTPFFFFFNHSHSTTPARYFVLCFCFLLFSQNSPTFQLNPSWQTSKMLYFLTQVELYDVQFLTIFILYIYVLCTVECIIISLFKKSNHITISLLDVQACIISKARLYSERAKKQSQRKLLRM